jgi:hypothetical protein
MYTPLVAVASVAFMGIAFAVFIVKGPIEAVS